MKLSRSRGRKLLPFSTVKSSPAPPQPEAVLAGIRPISGLAHARVRRVRRGWVAAHLRAWIAVDARTPEVEFLRTRHQLYRGEVPRDLTAPIPETEISAGGDFVIADTDRRHPIDRIFEGPTEIGVGNESSTAEAVFQRAVAEAAGVQIGRRAAEIDEDIQTIDRQLREIDEQLDQITSERNDIAASRTRALESGRVDLTVARMPSLGLILFWRCCELATIAAECTVFFLALANTNGIDPTNLTVEWAQGAEFAIIGSALLALVTAGGTFVLAEAARELLVAARNDDEAVSRSRKRRDAVLLFAAVAIALVMIAVMRAELGTVGRTSLATIAKYFGLVAVALLAGAVFHVRGERLGALRTAALTRAATPDRLDVAAKLRRGQEVDLLEERARLRAERDACRADRQALNVSAFGGDQLLHDTARRERQVVDEFLDSVRRALALDQDAFRYFARKRGREHLLTAPAPVSGALVPIRRTRRPA